MLIKRELRLEDITNFIGNSVLVKVFLVLCLLTSLLPTPTSAVFRQIEEYKAKNEVEPLIAALKGKYSDVREAAACALGEIARAVEPLIAALRDKNDAVREVATEALDKIEPNWPHSSAALEQVPQFIHALRDKDDEVRKAASDVMDKTSVVGAWEMYVQRVC